MFFQKSNIGSQQFTNDSEISSEVFSESLQRVKTNWLIWVLVFIAGYLVFPKSKKSYKRGSNLKSKYKMENLKKYWSLALVVAVGAILMFTDKGKRLVETAKVWFK